MGPSIIYRESIRAILPNTTSSHNATNSSAIHNGTISANDLPHVGSIPLTEFIYALVGGLVFLIWLYPIYSFVELVRKEKRDIGMESSEPPPFMKKKAPPSTRLQRIARVQIHNKKAGLSIVPNLDSTVSLPILRPNLPLPVVTPNEPQGSDYSQGVITSIEVRDCLELVKQRNHIDIMIKNLQRVENARKAFQDENRTTSEKLREALKTRTQIQQEIDSTLNSFVNRRTSLTADEWRILQQVLACCGGGRG